MLPQIYADLFDAHRALAEFKAAHANEHRAIPKNLAPPVDGKILRAADKIDAACRALYAQMAELHAISYPDAPPFGSEVVSFEEVAK